MNKEQGDVLESLAADPRVTAKSQLLRAGLGTRDDAIDCLAMSMVHADDQAHAILMLCAAAEALSHDYAHNDERRLEALSLAREAVAHGRRAMGLLEQTDAKLAPFVKHQGRGPGPVRVLIEKVLPRLETNATHREIWRACKANPGRDLEFIERDGEPDHIWTKNGKGPGWEAFKVLISEVRRSIRERKIRG